MNDWVYQLQMPDSKLKHIFEALHNSLQTETEMKLRHRNGRLFRNVTNMKGMMIPERLR